MPDQTHAGGLGRYYADLHIHIGRTASGRPVKITGARTLTLENILHEAAEVKGIDLVGVIDSHVPEVLDELERAMEKHGWREHEGGGVSAGKVTLLLGSEIEVYDDHCHGPIHVLAFLPTVSAMRAFSVWLGERVKNVSLSTQRLHASGRELQQTVKERGGWFIPAHAFTPFKSLYGRGVERSLTEVFDPDLIDAVELGLSADTAMADQIAELHRYPYLTNSDAHSLRKIAREYEEVRLSSPTFAEFEKALRGEDGRVIVANYGLNPKLGKYHQTVCERCLAPAAPDVDSCAACGHHRVVKGVFDRLEELKTAERGPKRPPYIYQVPLEFIPGLGPKAYEKLLGRFGTEIRVLHEASEEEIAETVGEKLAQLIVLARSGALYIEAGGGGRYGKVREA
ncbi:MULTISPECIES: endonuclease Q family protein [Geobacillus]|uniref:endonuclease Q family protein n=1 Tax=Geobacillus TaxID=129337 RepID=UPI000C28CB26|nr:MULTISPECIES: endonuclease Q family protein [Geobacillus]MED0655234.1 endonuclease Q family protein [Anoxybacillus geothermalis]MDF9295657.1 endonuclease Q family protein [Geobacillus stearothermophilus]PJW14410.1 TIGR00375 family protein [Geobacillus sp. Manikaran-105]PJW17467.1 TIGR00375 family protein [Geobacillus sp. WSUCF-018B]WJQ15157.1 endonuclease Q family protein [Geobacillus stearothermophilus]